MSDFEHISEITKRAIARSRMYDVNVDPSAERAILMRKHRLTWNEALNRWPLSEYDNWKRHVDVPLPILSKR